MPSFHGAPRGTSGQASRPSTPRPHAGPHVDERVAGDQHVRVADLARQPRLLGPGDEVVDEDAEAPLRRRPERLDRGREVVDAVHRLDDDARRRAGRRPTRARRSSASWRPSTQIRLAAATLAGAAGPATEPDAVTVGARRRGRPPGGAASPAGPRAGTRPASTRSGAGAAGGRAASPPRSSTRTTSPQNPLARSSTTMPDGDVDLGVARPAGGRRRSRRGCRVRRPSTSDSSTGTAADRGASHRPWGAHHATSPSADRRRRHRRPRPRRPAALAGDDDAPRRRRRRRRPRPSERVDRGDGATATASAGRRRATPRPPRRAPTAAPAVRRPSRDDAGARPGDRHRGAGDVQADDVAAAVERVTRP